MVRPDANPYPGLRSNGNTERWGHSEGPRVLDPATPRARRAGIDRRTGRPSSDRGGMAMSEQTNRRGSTDGGQEIHRSQHDVVGPEPITVTIVKAVAAAIDEDPLDLPPLRDVVHLDLDALDDLFVHDGVGSPAAETYLRFEYLDHVVVVYGDGCVSVREPLERD